MVRRSDGPAESPWDGEEVCRVSPSANACVHEGAVPGEISIYTAFALAAPSNASSGLSSDPIAAEFPTISLAGDDRAVLGGERVRLRAQGQDPNSSVAWVQVDGSPVDLLDADTSRPWFIAPDTADTLTFQVTGQIGGFEQSDTVDVAVTPYAGLETEVLDNPFRSLLFEGVDGVTLAYDADRGIAWASTGSELYRLDLTDDDTILSTTSGSWPQAREVDGDLLVLWTCTVAPCSSTCPTPPHRWRSIVSPTTGASTETHERAGHRTLDQPDHGAHHRAVHRGRHWLHPGQVFERQGTGSVGGVTLLPGMLNMVVVRTQSQAPGHHAIIDLAAVATLGNQDGSASAGRAGRAAQRHPRPSPRRRRRRASPSMPRTRRRSTSPRCCGATISPTPPAPSCCPRPPEAPPTLPAPGHRRPGLGADVGRRHGVRPGHPRLVLLGLPRLVGRRAGRPRHPPQAPTALHVASWLGGSDAGVLRWTLGADLGPLEGVEVLTSSQLFMFPEGSAVDGRTLALRTYDDILGVHGEGSLQSTSYSQYWGSYELGRTMCIRDGVISFVENVGGAPWVSRLDLVGDDPGFSFEVDGDCGATACVGDTLVSLCASNTEARAWSLDTGASRGTVAISGTNFPLDAGPARHHRHGHRRRRGLVLRDLRHAGAGGHVHAAGTQLRRHERRAHGLCDRLGHGEHVDIPAPRGRRWTAPSGPPSPATAPASTSPPAHGSRPPASP